MPKSNSTHAAPLIMRPVEEILAAARGAGRKAFVTRKVIEDHCDAVSLDWIDKTFPSSLGVMDDDAFGELMSRVTASFDEGVLEYLDDCTTIAALQREVRDEQFDKECAAEIIHWLAGMFSAIDRAARDLPHGSARGLILQLAGCGNYVASDRAEMIGYTDRQDAEAAHD